MKLLFIVITALSIASCKPIHKSNNDEVNKSLISKCPEDGVCSFEVLKNKSLIVKTDEFGNRYQEVVNGEHNVLKFEYKRNELPDTADSNYIEEIYLELNPDDIIIQLHDSELKKVKLLYGRLCFCRGQSGYYQIDKGALSVAKLDGDTYQVHLEFKCDEVPQVIEVLNETFKL